MMLCDICNEKLHYQKKEAKLVLKRCPLEPFKKVKSFYNPEFRNLINSLTVDYDINILDNSPKCLHSFKEIVPEESKLLNTIKYTSNDVYTKTLLIESSILDFFLHFSRVLIDIYYIKEFSYISTYQKPIRGQFNYAWVTPTKLKEFYFSNSSEEDVKGISDLSKPSLVIYPLGIVQSYENKAWGDIVSDLITNREAEGKPTWIVKSKPYNNCVETNRNLELLLDRMDQLALTDLSFDILENKTESQYV